MITLSVSGQHHRAEVSELKSTPEGYVTYNKGQVSLTPKCQQALPFSTRSSADSDLQGSKPQTLSVALLPWHPLLGSIIQANR